MIALAPPSSPEAVDLVDEDDAGRRGPRAPKGRLEQLARLAKPLGLDGGRTELHQGDAALGGGGAYEQRLPRPRRAVEQSPRGRAQGLGPLQEEIRPTQRGHHRPAKDALGILESPDVLEGHVSLALEPPPGGRREGESSSAPSSCFIALVPRAITRLAQSAASAAPTTRRTTSSGRHAPILVLLLKKDKIRTKGPTAIRTRDLSMFHRVLCCSRPPYHLATGPLDVEQGERSVLMGLWDQNDSSGSRPPGAGEWNRGDRTEGVIPRDVGAVDAPSAGRRSRRADRHVRLPGIGLGTHRHRTAGAARVSDEESFGGILVGRVAPQGHRGSANVKRGMSSCSRKQRTSRSYSK